MSYGFWISAPANEEHYRRTKQDKQRLIFKGIYVNASENGRKIQKMICGSTQHYDNIATKRIKIYCTLNGGNVTE